MDKEVKTQNETFYEAFSVAVLIVPKKQSSTVLFFFGGGGGGYSFPDLFSAILTDDDNFSTTFISAYHEVLISSVLPEVVKRAVKQ